MNCSHVIAAPAYQLWKLDIFKKGCGYLQKFPINQSQLYVVWQCVLCHVAVCTMSYVTVSCGSVHYVVCHCVV